MAGKSSNNRKRQTGSSSRKGSNSRKQTIDEPILNPDIVLFLTIALGIFLELCNFHVIGPVGEVISSVMFGLGGVMAYLLPVALVAIVFFGYLSRESRVIKVKFITGICLFVLVLIFVEEVFGCVRDMETLSVADIWSNGSEMRHGGGVIAGLIAFFMHKYMGMAGTLLVVIVLMLVCIMLLMGRERISSLKQNGREAYASAREERERRRLEYEEEMREYEESNRAKDSTPRNGSASATDAEENLPRYARKRRGVASSVLNNEDDKPVGEEYKEIEIKDNIPRRNRKVSGVMMDTTIENRKPAVRNDIHEITVKNTESEPVIERTYVRSETVMDSVVAPLIHEEVSTESEITFNKGGADTQTDVYDASATAEPVTNKNTQVKNNPAPVRNRKYRMPTPDLLNKSSSKGGGSGRDELLDTARNLMDTLNTFGVKAKVTDISQGPSVTRYELQPEVGVRVNKIVSLSDDLKLALAATDIRIEAPIPGKSAVGIEVPNKEAGSVSFRELIEDKTFKNFDSKIAFAVGKDIAGNVVVTDIAKMPHMLIAGATGSGKSVCINTIIMSILYKATPDEVKLIMIDPKVVELSVYNGIPHLMVPVVTDPKKAAAALHWGVAEMTKRYQLFADMNVRDLKGYNKAVENYTPRDGEEKKEKLPQIVIIVDELADLMMVAAKEVEESICRLAQLARACGIHLVIATQRPSVDVITGLIKANMPSRVAFAVSSGTDSRTILDMNGAEKLLGKGDMLFFPQGYPKPARIQGAFISDSEVSRVVDFLRSQNYGDNNGEELLIKMDSVSSSGSNASGDDDRDELFEPAGRFIIESDKASIGSLQRKFKIGFNRAARIMDQLSDAGVVGPEEGTKPRQILMNMSQFDDYVNY